MAKKEKTSENGNPAEVIVFTKEQLLSMERYLGRTDLLSVLLVSGEMYTAKDADAMIADFLKGRVK